MKKNLRNKATLSLTLMLLAFHVLVLSDTTQETSPDSGIAPCATFEDGPVIPTED